MERQVEEIFEYNGEWYQCMEGTGCYRCAFYDKNICIADNPHCTCRSDKKNVIFKKLEKIKDPFVFNNMLYQRLKSIDNLVCAHCTFFNESCSCPSALCGSNLGYFLKTAGIKQYLKIKEDMKKKEDMKEEKLNLKKFDLEAAKAGKPVCTRDGRKARIISFDRKFLFKGVSYPIIALVEDTAKEETIYGYNEKGKVIIENDTPYKDDLMMLPQKKEGWVRIYKSASNVYYLSSNIYKTEEEAKHSSDCCYVGASKISWEE